MLPLTLRLVIQPERGWPQLAAALHRGQHLPAPWVPICALGAISGLMTLLGGAIAPHLSWTDVLLHASLVSAGCCLGPIIALYLLASRYTASHVPPEHTQHFIGSSTLPIAVSGVLGFIPLPGLSWICTLAATGLSGFSASIGASVLLGLEGKRRLSAARDVAITAAIIPLLASTSRFFLGD